MFNTILSSQLSTSGGGFTALILIIIVSSIVFILNKKNIIKTTFWGIYAFIGFYIFFGKLLYKTPSFPGGIWFLLQIVLIISTFASLLYVAISYFILLRKKRKKEKDINKRKRLITFMSIIISFCFYSFPFFVNSWGIDVIGNLDGISTLKDEAASHFFSSAILICIYLSTVVFLADNVINRIVTPIYTSNDIKTIEKFCLYLRSFNVDNNKEEKMFCEVLRRLYPVYAIGDPNRILQPNGAKRIYVTDNVWKETVNFLSEKSKLILLRIGDTNGTLWELTNIFDKGLLHKTIFISYSNNNTLYFSEILKEKHDILLEEFATDYENPIAFFINNKNVAINREICSAGEIESLINDYLEDNEQLNFDYEKDLQLRNHSLKYIFNKSYIPQSVWKSLNWGFMFPIVNIRHWPYSSWLVFTIVTILMTFDIIIPYIMFLIIMLFLGNRIEWAVGIWSSDKQFLKEQRREAKILWFSMIIAIMYSTISILIAIAQSKMIIS